MIILQTQKLIQDQGKLHELDQVIGRYADKPGQLIRVLQEAQQIFGYLPEGVQCYVADRLSIPISEVAGVVSFYSLFSTKPKGRHSIGVCLGTACYVKGSQEILNTIKKELKIDVEQTTEDGLFTLTSTRCIGACGLAPVMAIDGEVYGRVKASEVVGILNKYRDGAAAGAEGAAFAADAAAAANTGAAAAAKANAAASGSPGAAHSNVAAAAAAAAAANAARKGGDEVVYPVH